MAGHVVFIHGLWIHSAAWEPWLDLFSSAGYQAAAPGWPGDGDTVAQTREAPERVAGFGVQDLTNHYAEYIAGLPESPVVVGHSFGGLIAQKLLAAGLARSAVAIDPAPVKGVRALPFAQIRSGFPVLRSKKNAGRSVMLTHRQFRYGFGNAISQAESDRLYERWAIPGPGRPIFELTAAKKDPASPALVDLDDSDRGPLLILGGLRDHTVPEIVARQAAALYKPGTNTEYRPVPGRGHSLVFDRGWREVAETVLEWVRRQDRAQLR
ncbi:alpha/beta hydrolase [Planotetraspora mira]|uniref:Alpha/beta hydrolase n=1 Tax=Planotetraspora mira TaxID=58121 RepID=A0A8J3X9Z0_9ACTN|nr:alpha/beta hydrolase [Planotetraspora mira]GII32494.1 alpha/beta hydrolase [Planotetraspora mira]